MLAPGTLLAASAQIAIPTELSVILLAALKSSEAEARLLPLVEVVGEAALRPESKLAAKQVPSGVRGLDLPAVDTEFDGKVRTSVVSGSEKTESDGVRLSRAPPASDPTRLVGITTARSLAYSPVLDELDIRRRSMEDPIALAFFGSLGVGDVTDFRLSPEELDPAGW